MLTETEKITKLKTAKYVLRKLDHMDKKFKLQEVNYKLRLEDYVRQTLLEVKTLSGINEKTVNIMLQKKRRKDTRRQIHHFITEHELRRQMKLDQFYKKIY